MKDHEMAKGSLAKEEKGSKGGKKKSHPYRHMHVEFHDNGSGTVHFQHETDPMQDVKQAVPDMDAIHDALEDHAGTPNPGEAEAEAGAPEAPNAGQEA